MNKQADKYAGATPGPWEIGAISIADGAIGITKDRYYIAQVTNAASLGEILTGGEPATQWANARLIADAPTLAADNVSLRASRDELLSALQMAHGVLFLLTDEVRALGHGAENIPAKVSAAISAATGQPS
jgi:hypothetical protein